MSAADWGVGVIVSVHKWFAGEMGKADDNFQKKKKRKTRPEMILADYLVNCW